MENQLEKKYGLITAISMVVGIVIGSGVFFKAEKVLNLTGGNLSLGILAWVLGGIIMLSCAYTFSIMAQKYNCVNGLVDYAYVTLGDRFSYNIGWFMATIYYPSLVAIVSWVTARYTCALFNINSDGGVMTIAAFFLVSCYALNTLAPIIAGKVQVSTTIIKLIPLFAMAVLGTIRGLSTGLLAENFTHIVREVNVGSSLFSAVAATAFAYDGWIVATSINAELKNPKRDLPLALTVGSIIVVSTYVLYYVGLAGGASNELLMTSGEDGVRIAFTNILSTLGGTTLFVFVVISCLGTLNGLTMGNSRGMYMLTVRNQGPAKDCFKQVDKSTNVPANSAVFGVLISVFWLLYFYGTQLTDSWLGKFVFDISELPIISMYGMFIPMFITLIIREKSFGFLKRVIMPCMSILSCIFMVIASIVSHKMGVVYYLITFGVIMIIGNIFYRSSNNNN